MRPPTRTATSFEAALVPLSLCASTRKKYVPPGTFGIVSVGSADPVVVLTRSACPLAVPVCTTYVVGVPPLLGAVQFRTTVRPLTVAVSPVGAPGGTIARTALAAYGTSGMEQPGGGIGRPNGKMSPTAYDKQSHGRITSSALCARAGTEQSSISAARTV